MSASRHPLVGDVPVGVDRERVPAERVADGPRLDPRQVHAARRELLEHRRAAHRPRCRAGARRASSCPHPSAPARHRGGPRRRTGSTRARCRRCRGRAPSARTCSTAAGGTSAASKPRGASTAVRAAISAAGAVFDVAGTCTTSGRCADSQRRHCTHACGCAAIRRTSSRRTPGAAASVNCTGTSTSRSRTSGAPTASESSVAVTPPSTVLSIATTAKSAVPDAHRLDGRDDVGLRQVHGVLGCDDLTQRRLGERAGRAEVGVAGCVGVDIGPPGPDPRPGTG